MYVSTNRFWLRISVSMRSLLWLSLGMALVMSSRMAVGQEDPAPAPAQTQFGDAVEDGWLFSDQLTGQSGEAFGAKFRAGVQTGPTVGRDVSIVPIELMPYAFAGKGMIFGDIRGFRATTDDWGANLGGGFRYHSEQLDRIFGANAYYDYDNTSGALFRQVGFGLETLGALWDMRANVYLPTGKTEQLLGINLVTGSERFVGHRILFSQIRTIGSALSGLDMEVATPLPGRVLQRHDVRVAAGWYRYEGNSIDGFAGWKTRIQGNLLPSIQLQLEVTHDKIFSTNVVFGAAWTYGGYRQPETERRTQFSRMTEPVRRNYNLIVAKTKILDPPQVAINPNTGVPYFVEHVASYAPIPGADGTFERPWQTVNQAQTDPAFAPSIAAAGGDIIFVHGGSVFDTAPNNSVTLTPSIRILGEGDGVEHRVNIANLIGQIPLPKTPNAVLGRPLFAGSPANGVTLVSGSTAVFSEFSGFRIGDSADPTSGPIGHGIIGDGLADPLTRMANVLVTQNTVNFAGGDGVLLTNLTGPVTFRGNLINDPAGSAFHVSGGIIGSRVTFGDDPVSNFQGQIVNTGGRALLVENTPTGSFVNLTGSTITDTAGLGILIDNANGSTVVDQSTINNSLVTGIEVRGGGGITSFVGAVLIDNPFGDAISIHDTLAGSATSFGATAVAGAPAVGPVTITNRNARGINLFNTVGQVSFFGPVSVTDTVVPFVLPAAIEYQSSSANVLFGTVTLDGGLGDGILIGEAGTNNSGQFLVAKQTNISNFARNGVLVTDDDSRIQFNGLNVSNRGLSGVNVNNNRGTLVFQGLTSIDNLGVSISPGADFQNNTAGSASFDLLTITGATRPVGNIGGAGLNVINAVSSPASVSVKTLTVTSANGIGLFVNNSGDRTTTPPTGGVSISTGTIDTTGSRPAVEVRNSVIQLQLQRVSSANSLTQGIVLTNNIGSSLGNLFTITGINGALTTGGGISGAGADGVLLQNTGGVSLSGMTITGSTGDGIDASTTAPLPINTTATTTLAVFNSTISGNGGFGVQTLNVPAVAMFGNTIQANVLSEVQLIAATNTLYTYVIGDRVLGRNTITDVNNDAVVISTQGGGIGSNLDFTFINNTVSTTGIFTGLQVNWNGPVVGVLGGDGTGADVNLNIFNSVGSGATAIRFNLPSATAASNVNILSNTYTATGNGIIGVDVTTGGGISNIFVGKLLGQVLGNNMQFTGLSDRAIQMTLGANSTATVSDNTIVMNGDLSEAILFPLVQGVSSLFIQRNIITINDPTSGFVINERGIDIQAVTGSVTLFGESIDSNNIQMNGFRGSDLPFFSAPGTILGRIFVNGVQQP